MRHLVVVLGLCLGASIIGCASETPCDSCGASPDAGPPDPGQTCAQDNGGCDALTTCADSAAGVTCGPCPAGYDGDGRSGCVDIDECAAGTHDCDPLAGCVNDAGSFHCGECAAGFEDVLGDGTQCRCSGAGCWSAISAGREHSCGLRAGEMYCWGDNASGQLGIGTVGAPESLPTRVGTNSDWEQVSVGGVHACGIRAGDLYCWGSASGGQIGTGLSGNDMREPAPVMVDAGVEWSLVAAGGTHTCGLSAGALYCWGYNAAGQLGDGTQDSRAVPTAIGTETTWSTVAASDLMTCGIRNGELYCWGDERLAQDRPSVLELAPKRVDDRTDWEFVALDSFSLCGIASGELHCWGFNGAGMLGDGTTMARAVPVRVGTDSDWNLVAMGSTHACGIRGTELFCWGSAYYGAVGSGMTTGQACKTGLMACELAPLPVGMGDGWSAIDVGVDFSCGVRSGQALCWGKNELAQLGDGTLDQRNAPVPVASM